MPKKAKCDDHHHHGHHHHGHHHHHHHHHGCQSNVKCLIQLLEALSVDCDHHHEVEGSITLNQGVHEITVATDEPVDHVFLSVKPVGTPVCVGDIDKVGYSVVDEGFILYADIKSAVAEICYILG